MGKLFGVFLVMSLFLAMAVHTKSDDLDDLKDLIACVPYVLCPANPKTKPSDACCKAIQKLDSSSIWSMVITKETEKSVCMENVKYAINYCKKPFQLGSRLHNSFSTRIIRCHWREDTDFVFGICVICEAHH
uniref:Bifunctional inhibitor/plant lipid transfer protein/seed storage helical domain-containing protein n=1 Tax=Leersia perrieri TaxID=77586 RepID=A0A0D9V668_9ORYZ